MVTAAIHPLPMAWHADECARSPSAAVPRAIDDVVYRVELVAPLPPIDVTKTLIAALLGRGNDAAFNARVITVSRRLEPIVTHVSSVAGWANMALFGVADLAWRRALSCVAGVAGTIGLALAIAPLSTDMLRLLATTFEFWFLIATVSLNMTLWSVLFHDERIAMTVVSGLNFMSLLLFDASVHNRRFVAGGMLFGAPGLLIGVVLVAFHVPPDLQYASFDVLGLRIEALDLLVTGSLLITFFTASRIARSRRIVFSKAPIERIDCDMYFPICRLVAVPPVPLPVPPIWESDDHDDKATVSLPPLPSNALRRLHLVRSDEEQHIDATQLLLPRLVQHYRAHTPRATRHLTVLGLTGLVTCATRCLVTATTSTVDVDMSWHIVTLDVVTIATTLLFAAIYVAHLQRTLAWRIIAELDAWFVSLQLATVVLGLCDVFDWHTQAIVLAVAAWIWCHWTLCLDAMPPVTRRLLGFDHRMVLLVHVLMVVSPVVLGYVVYFSPTRAALRNRVLLAYDFGGSVTLRVETQGFLASKLFTLWLWMGRLLYRELVRPRDAFKLLKRRVYYDVVT